MAKEEPVTLEEFRDIMAKITEDKEIFMKLVNAHEKENVEEFRALVKRCGIPRCIVVCHLICWVQHYIRCARVCRVLCY